ncbi:hypothetical protein AB4Y85_07100 [Microvirga sp. 2YAF29]|uniref:hypothetical protein n=1 Tax=Microvirga sp. 2YAF29 TaxID=3233031 RepID=UPI003F9E6D77
MSSQMILTWIGVILVIAGVLYGVAQALGQGRLSVPRRMGPTGASESLEPPDSVKAFSLRTHWPALALITVGAILILTETAF